MKLTNIIKTTTVIAGLTWLPLSANTSDVVTNTKESILKIENPKSNTAINECEYILTHFPKEEKHKIKNWEAKIDSKHSVIVYKDWYYKLIYQPVWEEGWVVEQSGKLEQAPSEKKWTCEMIKN